VRERIWPRGKLDAERAGAVTDACDAILDGGYEAEFPLSVWQTGSGTQTNMNVNEVVARLASEKGSDRATQTTM
jgi:fumarate hydratase class II